MTSPTKSAAKTKIWHKIRRDEYCDQGLMLCWKLTDLSGIDAVLQGVPNVACDTGSMVYDVSSTDIAEIENPYRGDKKEWCNKIAHCQWGIDEFESGECWEHVSKSI